MKKAKFLALALVVAIMMVGAGYAYWQETLEIKTTVNTGKLDFEIRGENISNQDQYMEESTANAKSVFDGQVLDVTLDKMYPGSEATVTFKIANTGTMAAKIDNFKVDEGLYLYNPIDKNSEEENSEEYSPDVIFLDDYFGKLKLTSLKVDGEDVLTEEISIEDLAKGKKKVFNTPIDLEKGAERKVDMTFKVDESANDYNFEEDGWFKFTIEADILQHNDPN